MQLRDYQIKAISLLKQSLKTGHKRPILRLDCGAGKTAIASFLALQMSKKNKKMLFLTHLQEIADQTLKTLDKFNVPKDCVDVGMIITVSHNLDKYNPDVIICDECNFALSKTWRTVLDYYKNAIIIGLSASPIRLSGEPMGDVFDDIIDFMTADDLIKMGYLSEYDHYAPKLNYSIENAKMKGSDFDADAMEEIINDHKLYGDIIKYFKQYANNKKTICYCTNIKHSKETAQMFRDAGYSAEHIDGTLSKTKRAEIIERFRTGETQILTNVNLISFGFDCPDCDCVVSLRPTASVCLYIQAYSRALRKNGNNRAVILDFSANVFRFGMVTDKREWSLTGKMKCKNISAEPDIITRQCNNCFKVYSGNNRICPYCGFDNGKTRKQIEADKKAELERITEIKKKNARMEVGMAKDVASIVKIAVERGYKMGWVWQRCKFKGIYCDWRQLHRLWDYYGGK